MHFCAACRSLRRLSSGKYAWTFAKLGTVTRPILLRRCHRSHADSGQHQHSMAVHWVRSVCSGGGRERSVRQPLPVGIRGARHPVEKHAACVPETVDQRKWFRFSELDGVSANGRRAICCMRGSSERCARAYIHFSVLILPLSCRSPAAREPLARSSGADGPRSGAAGGLIGRRSRAARGRRSLAARAEHRANGTLALLLARGAAWPTRVSVRKPRREATSLRGAKPSAPTPRRCCAPRSTRSRRRVAARKRPSPHPVH